MASTPVRKDWLWAICRVVDATEGTVHLVRDLANIVLKLPEQVLGLPVVANDGLLSVLLGLGQRDLL